VPVKRRIRELRFRQGWTRSDLARRAGVSVRTVQRWEEGEYRPRVETFEALCRALRCSPEELLR
jgi:transcriptional regulator with XRE-family HTH domain